VEKIKINHKRQKKENGQWNNLQLPVGRQIHEEQIIEQHVATKDPMPGMRFQGWKCP